MLTLCSPVREGALWEMEERQLQEMDVLKRGHLKESFFVKRQQMMSRQEKVLDVHVLFLLFPFVFFLFVCFCLYASFYVCVCVLML